MINFIRYLKFILIIFIILLSFKAYAFQQNINIFAASSLTDVMDKICKKFERDNNCKINLNLDSSGRLYHQIYRGAPADVFISASDNYIKMLQKNNMISISQPITYGELVVIAPVNSKIKFSKLTDMLNLSIGSKIALAEVESVPAGIYAKQVLVKLDIWEKLTNKSSGIVVMGNNVRAVLSYVEKEEVDLGFVYLSDAMISKKVKIVYKVEENLHDRIIFSAAIIKNAQNPDIANKFTEFLKNKYSQDILKSYGFK